MKFKKGFTLVEMLIYMGLLGILLIALTDLFVAILGVKLESESNSFIEQDGRYILARLSNDVSMASSISVPSSLGSSGSSLSLVINGSTYIYTISAGNLQMVDNIGTVNLNSSETSITNLNFQKIGNVGGKETVRMDLTLESKIERNTGKDTKSFKTTFGRRK